MNLNEILKGDQNAKDKYVNFLKNQTSFSSGASRISNGRYTLKRLKMEAGDAIVVVPLMIHLPLSYGGELLKEPMPYVGSFETTISLIKSLAAGNTAFAGGLQSILGEGYDKLDLTKISEVSKEERGVFWRFRRPLVYERTVMSVKAASSARAFGTPYAVDIATDPESGAYIDDVNNPLIWSLHKLEATCLAAKVKALREENEAAGDKRRTDQDLNSTIKSLWDNRVITNPYPLGTTRILFFKCDNNHEILPETKKSWTADLSGIRSNEYYIKINKKLIEKFDNNIGSKWDRYDDFLLLIQNTPTFTEADKASAAQSISRLPASSEDAIENQLKDFIPAYTDFRNNMEIWDEKVIRASAFEYRTISDENIAKIFKESMGTLTAALHTQEVFETYGDVIAKLDSELSNELMSSALNSGLKEAGDVSRELESAPTITENTPGYGGDDAMAAESDSQAMMDVLTSD